MGELEKIRIDKWLWAVRIYKTRELASKGCNSGKVKLEGNRIKPSRQIKKKDIVTVQKGYINYKYEVVNLLEKRTSAKLLSNYVNDITPENESIKSKIVHNQKIDTRKKGLGRPTKKNRRIIDKNNWKTLEN